MTTKQRKPYTVNPQNPPGRKRGYRPKTERNITHTQGAWAWDHRKIERKLDRSTDEDCWPWLGSTSPSANLQGAYKNGKPQMTQVNRLIAMQQGHDMEHQQVRMRCHNKQCSNPNHFIIEPLQRRNRVD